MRLDSFGFSYEFKWHACTNDHRYLNLKLYNHVGYCREVVHNWFRGRFENGIYLLFLNLFSY